jgi:hypothetical protein
MNGWGFGQRNAGRVRHRWSRAAGVPCIWQTEIELGGWSSSAASPTG